MAIGDILGGIGGFIFGDSSKSRDKQNEQNWQDYNDARAEYAGAQAYQSALRNYAEDNPEEWKKTGNYFGDVLSDDFLKDYGSYVGDTRSNFEKQYQKNRFKEFGEGGIINETLNPMMQVLSVPTNAISGLGGGEFDNWSNNGSYRNRRDIASDIGALGETAFNIAGMGSLGDAVKGGAKLMSNVGKTALRTGALGAGENAFSTIREQGQDTDWGDLATSAALGGVIGGGLGAISQFGGNAANIAKQVRSPQMQAFNGYYQQALAGRAQPLNSARMLGDGVGGASVGTAGNYLDWVPKQAKAAMERSGTPLAKTGLGRVAQGIADSRAIYGSPLSSIANSKLGQTTKNILKTPYGKIGAGVGGGLLLANLLRGNGQPAQEMSDAELEQLMNYYNGGY
jgi:hypothetical protein